MLLTRVALLLAVALLLPGPAGGQGRTDPPAAAPPVGCPAGPETARLTRTLPVGVLDRLERLSESAFVHAYLIHFVAHPEAGEHRLSKCARAFVRPGETELSTLRRNLPGAREILRELRAEAERVEGIQRADSAGTLQGLVVATLRDGSDGALLGAREPLARAQSPCPYPGSICGTLSAVVQQLDSLHLARERLRAAAREEDEAATAARGAREALEAVLAARMGDTAQALPAAEPAAPIAPEQARPDPLEVPPGEQVVGMVVAQPEEAGWDTVIAPLETRFEEVTERLERARRAREAVADTVARWTTAARGALNRLSGQLETSRIVRQVDAVRGEEIGTAVIDVAPPPTPAAATASRVGSGSLMVELAGFIMERARRELVNSFLINLHGWARRDSLLIYGFPETWKLMSGLPTMRDSSLQAVAVGRIPLNVWRATFASDYALLPVNLLRPASVRLCGPMVATANADTAGQCHRRVATLKPLSGMAAMLLRGEPLLEVLQEAPSLVPAAHPALPAEWRRVAQGVRVVSEMSRVFLVQGHAPEANPRNHPYILTERALEEVAGEQRDAFLRLLLLRAIPAGDTLGDGFSPAAVEREIGRLVDTLEELTGDRRETPGGAAEALRVVRLATSSWTAAVDLGTAIHGSDPPLFRDVKERWLAFSNVLEPMVARDFGMALARTTHLVREVLGTEPPGTWITLAGLAASLSEARSGDEVRQAFEAAASPSGGWQAKRYGDRSITLNAYPGVGFACEWLLDYDDDGWCAGRAVGLGLPLGVEIPLSSDTADCFICATGVLVSGIDLGALLTYRVSDLDEVESVPEASLRQVFAPGLFLTLGLTRRFPTSLVMGYQFMPGLREATGVDGEAKHAHRFGVALALDLLLLRF